MPPVNGIGVYFGIDAARLPIFSPICSNGANAAAATLLTPLAAMNATQMNTSAMISMMIVPMIPHA